MIVIIINYVMFPFFAVQQGFKSLNSTFLYSIVHLYIFSQYSYPVLTQLFITFQNRQYAVTIVAMESKIYTLSTKCTGIETELYTSQEKLEGKKNIYY